jgi:hypothetical protein
MGTHDACWLAACRSRASSAPTAEPARHTPRLHFQGELVLAGGSGNGYRLAELMGATNPSGWSGVIKVKTPAGATLGYILLYSNP